MAQTELNFDAKAIWRLVWPQMLMMYLLFFSGIVTVWVAGQISSEVQAAMGLITQCAMFLMVVITSISSGATAAISQSIGMGRMLRARLYISATVIGSLLLGLLMALPGWCFDEEILTIIQTPPEIRAVCLELWPVAILGLPLQYVFYSTGVMFRATRLVIPPLYVAAIIAAANLVGCLGFGLGWFGLPAKGYMAIIWTSVATQCIGAVVNCLLLARSGYWHPRDLPSPAWCKKALPYLMRVALPAGAAQLVWQSGYLTLFILVASLPRDSVSALAGLTAGLRAESLLFMPAMAFNTTASVLVGNALGMGDNRRAKSTGLKIAAGAVVLMSLMAIFIWPFRENIAMFLSTEPQTRSQIVSYLSYNLATTPFSIGSTVMGGIMVGAGATQYNLMVFGGSFWLIRMPLGWYLGHRLWESASGVFAAMAVSQIIQTCIMLYVVLYRDWTRFAMRRSGFGPKEK